MPGVSLGSYSGGGLSLASMFPILILKSRIISKRSEINVALISSFFGNLEGFIDFSSSYNADNLTEL